MGQFLSSGLDQGKRSIANGASRNTPIIDKPGLNSAKTVVLCDWWTFGEWFKRKRGPNCGLYINLPMGKFCYCFAVV